MGLLVVAAIITASTGYAEDLAGTHGVSNRWGSGWINLQQTTDFSKGDRIRLKVGGSATRVLVRFLTDLELADEPLGIDGGVQNVPDSRVVDLTLTTSHPGTRQISVHGGHRAWDWSLGGDNGPATLETAERLGPGNE